ncbi:Lsr2 dimerization domain-containing protein [Nonomuraea jabiensis]
MPTTVSVEFVDGCDGRSAVEATVWFRLDGVTCASDLSLSNAGRLRMARE